MWFRRFFLAALAGVLAGTCAHAGQLSIDFHDPLSPTVHDIEWNPASPSPVMVFGIENTTSTTDKLYGWQLGLEIVPGAGATGSLRFNEATLPTSYLLDGRSGGLVPSFSGPSATISVIGDTDSLFTGVTVPSSGKNLLHVDFDALPGTSGLFYVKAVPDLFNGSNWYSSDFNARDYANVPFGGGSVTLGSINVVPEPSTIALLTTLSLAGAPALLRWRRRHGHTKSRHAHAR